MIHPTSGFCLLQPIPKTQGTHSFYVSAKDTNNQLQEVSEVLAVGPDLTTDCGATITAPCKVGDKVFSKSWTFDHFTYLGKNYSLVRFQDITGTIEE